ncbi:MAG TPA: SDR family oxidoreductase [Actinomycetota bacterium]|jgi:NAD(P)-dependent dehydrogenase (short-subunit alcohol dehydrogenase family)|nr:SDR family oxidoreductase [Actinomycetota bacterium]
MNGKTVLVTGANTGIGLETAAGLAGLGAEVVITSRDSAKGAAAVKEIKERHPDADVSAMQLDLARLDDVRRFAREFKERFPHLHVLVNNAGLILNKRQLTEDGFEATFQINHLGPFLLTHLLLDKLKESAPSRIVNVASAAHRGGRLNFDDMQSERGYRGMRVYGTTKLYNILFAKELARRLEGTGVTAYSLHPGTVNTRFGKDGDTGLFGLGAKISGPFFLSPAQGARTSIHVASEPGLEQHSGGYFQRSKLHKPSSAARNDEAARELWERSAELLKL